MASGPTPGPGFRDSPAEPGSLRSSACRRPGSSLLQTADRPAGGPAPHLTTQTHVITRVGQKQAVAWQHRSHDTAILTDGSRAVDDGGDRRQRPGVAFQALVGPLGSKVRRKRAGSIITCDFRGGRRVKRPLTRSADTAVVMRAYGPLTRPPHTSSMPGNTHTGSDQVRPGQDLVRSSTRRGKRAATNGAN